MARQESDREDLLREATALVERIELAPAGTGPGGHIVIGFRDVGAISIYFGADVAYHFNSRGQLRRAYCDGTLIKAERGRLIAMQRVRRGNEVQLLPHKMLDDEQAEFLEGMQSRLGELLQQCRNNMLDTIGRIPADADVLGRAVSWLSSHELPSVAASPHAR